MLGRLNFLVHHLKWQLFWRVLCLVLILIPLFGLVRYNIDRKLLTEQFERQINGAVEVLSVGLRMPLWELDEVLIEEAVKSVSYVPDLLVVRITESDASRTERIFVRNEQKQLSREQDPDVVKVDALVQRPFAIQFKNNESAQGVLYFSDRNYRDRMRDSIVALSVQMILFALLIIVTMYYLVQRFVGKPLTRLSQALAPDAEPDLLEKTISNLPGNELRALAERYHVVLHELLDHREHLTEMVAQRTHALSETNELLKDEIQRRVLMEDELIKARKQADQANEAKTFFLAHMSHELRTPLNGILGYSQLLTTEEELAPSVREKVANIDSCGQHLLLLINRILDLVKIEEGHVECQVEAFGLQKLLNDVVTVVRPTASKKNIELLLTGLEDIPVAAMGDAHRLRQVLINLLGNAVKFTEQGSVTLRVSVLDGERIGFAICDTGPGIPERDLARIFEPFQQSGSSATQQKGGGTGLGLPIARRLVQLMGGDIAVRSVLGEGSEFSFDLPLPVAESTALVAEARRVVGIEGAVKPKALIVDDIFFNRDAFKRQLQGIGFVVDTAASAKEALDYLEQELPDIIFMDLRMPDMDGVTCAKIIRGKAPQLPILAFTASVFNAEFDQGIRENFDGLVLKPVDLQQACEAVAQCLPVRFVYATEVETFAPPNNPQDSVSLRVLSEAEREQLRRWLDSGALASIRGFSDVLHDRDPDLGGMLSSMARAYDIEGLRHLLNGNS